MKRKASSYAENQRAEEALRFTQFAIDHSGEAAFWMTPDARFFYVNQAASRLVGFTREELLSMSVHDIDPDYPAETWPENWQTIREHGSYTLESHLRAKGGRVFPVEITVNFLQSDGGEYNCSFVWDISERKRLEEALQHAREELEGKVERRLERGENYGLTFREMTVLYLVATGKADKEIALALAISPYTVSKHVASILLKMDAHSRTEAGVRAVREGLVG